MYKNLPNYLSYKDGCLHYEGIKLLDLVQKYNTPLEVAYTDTINKKIVWLKNLFNKVIEENKYEGKYFLLMLPKQIIIAKL